MRCTVDVRLPPAEASQPGTVRAEAERKAGVPPGRAIDSRILKRSIDARGARVMIELKVELSDDLPFAPEPPPEPLADVAKGPPVVVVGAGPAGLFAAVRCIELGARPIVLERGKDVRARRHDLAAITQRGVVDRDSNYCFGEGGAGTYSDGKLYTRSGKRGDVSAILRTFVAHGASPDILVDAHPHIGTNKLPDVVASMRRAIVAAGGEVHFGARVVDLVILGGAIRRVVVDGGTDVDADAVVLATGHSARDVWELLASRGVSLESKPFAIGVRVEHPQAVIDAARYHHCPRDPHLPPASYAAVQQVDGRGVYSFCMCPGGIIAPCATREDEVVTNGWSPSKRNNPFANSGVVVEVPAGADPFEGVRLQRALEHAAWDAGGRSQAAPAQRLLDFLGGRASSSLPACSYPAGIVPARVDELLPRDLASRLQKGIRAFGGSIRGYLSNDAVVVAVESRTSSPVRIPRDRESLEHPSTVGLYPCGEGAGYAGGIVSAALDGVRCAEKAAARVGATRRSTSPREGRA